MITNSGAVLKLTAGKPEDGLLAQINAKSRVISASLEIKDKDENVLFSCDMAASGNYAETRAVFDAEYWTLDAPMLYTACFKLVTESGEESFSDRFGFRTLTADNKYLYLNGFPFYMRAYIRGAAAHEHGNNCRLEEYEFYKKNILMAKSYGFNTIRFHSVIPPEACFRAADDYGILIHIETRAENEEYENLDEMINGVKKLVSDAELEKIVNTLYNHPSFAVYCVGNEIRRPGKTPRIKEIHDYIKARDNTRFFIDTCAHGEYDRENVDFDVQHMSYFYPYGKNADMFENTDNLLGFGSVDGKEMTVESDGAVIRRRFAFSRPLMAHEIAHYTAWRDFYALKEKFERYGVPAPWWVDEEIKMIEAKGYAEDFKNTQQITKNFQLKCWKTCLEAIRTSPLLSGFHMLQFADTDKYENSNGIVDCFDDPHGISAEDFRRFNGDIVIAAKLPERILNCSDSLRVPVMLSNYALNPAPVGDFSFTLSCGDKTLVSGGIDRIETAKSGLYEICALDIKIPELARAEKLILDCRLSLSDGSVIENNWELWAFPRENTKLTARLDMTENYLDAVVKCDENAELVITDKLDDKLFDMLDEGKSVMLIYRTDWTRHLKHKGMQAPKYSFVAVWERYKGVIWDRGTINGGKDKRALLERYGFPTDGEINYQYYNLIDDSDKINLDDFPCKCDSVVTGFDKSSRDRFDVKIFKFSELRYERTMRNFSYAFGLNVGKGKLFVTGFNFTSAETNPAVRKMLTALVSAFSNGEVGVDKISCEQLKSYLSSVAAQGPQKEGMMTQYWQLDEEPVETLDYWNESERYLRED